MRLSVAVLLAALALAPVCAQSPEVPSLRATGTGSPDGIGPGVFTPDGKTFLTCAGKVIRAWDAQNGKELFVLRGHEATIHQLALAGTRTLITGSADGRLFLWDLLEQKKVGELPKCQHPIHCLATTRDGKYVAAGTGQWQKVIPGELRVWDVAKRKEMASLVGHRHQIQGVAFSPDGKQLAAVDRVGDVKLWNLARKEAVTFHDERNAWSVQFAPDGRLLAVGDMWGRLRLYDAATLADEGMVPAHKGSIFRLDFAPSGRMVATTGADGKILLWNPHNLEEQRPLLLGNHTSKVWACVFSPDGRTLASGGEDKLVKFWSIPPGLEKQFPVPAKQAAPEKVVTRAGAVKVALVPAAVAEAARSVQELALVQLSGAENIELLERERIERLLQEQKLSLSGAVDAATAIQAGKILAVDVLAVIHHSPALQRNSGLVVFDAATGVKLADVGFSDPSLSTQALQAAEAVRSGLVRWRAGTRNLKTVCFLPVRNADLPRGMDHFCAAFVDGLERDLLNAGQTAVLERQRLDLVNREKTLAEGAAMRELLASLVTVTVELSRSKNGGVRASASVRDNAGIELHRLQQETTDPSGGGLLGPLAQQLQEVLKTTSPNASANRNRESRRFLREAELLWKHKHYLQGLQAAEAAFALKANDDTRKLLTEYLLRYATEVLDPGGSRTMAFGAGKREVTPNQLREGLALARRGLDLIDVARAAVQDALDSFQIGWWVEGWLVGDAQRFFFNKLPMLRIVPPSEEAQQELEDFRLYCLRRLVGQCEQHARGADRAVEALGNFQKAVVDAGEKFGYLAPTKLQETRALHDLGMKWLDLAAMHPVAKIPPKTASSFGTLLTRVYAPYLFQKPITEPIPLEIVARARQHAHPLIRLPAQQLELRLQVLLGKLTREEAIAQHQRLMEEGKRLIDRPAFEPHDDFRLRMYTWLGEAIARLQLRKFGHDVLQEYFDLCDFMLNRNDVMEDVIDAAVRYGSPHRANNLRALHILDRAVKLTDAKERRLFGGSSDRFKYEMKEARRTLLKALGEFAKQPVPWDSVEPLLTAEVQATLLLPGVRVHDGHIYLFTGGGDDKTQNRVLRLWCLPVAGGTWKLVGKTLVSVDNPPPWSRYHSFWISPDYFVTATAIAHGKLYVATTLEGILVFPLAGGDPQRIGEKEGLPAKFVHKVAVAGNTLLATLDGGYLVAYDLTTGKMETVASSRRSEARSAFDNTTPFRVTELIGDAARQRFLFTVQITGERDPRGGLWEYSVKSGKFRRLHTHVWGVCSQVVEGRFYILHSVHNLRDFQDHLLAYDLATDRFTVLQGKAPPPHEKLQPTGLPAGFSMHFPRQLVHGNWYWSGYPFGRRSLDGKTEEYFPSPNDYRGVYPFSGHVCLQALSPTELLVGGYDGLFRLRLKRE